MKLFQAVPSLLLLSLLALPLACKDEEPCDETQDSIGTGCYAKTSGGSAGSASAAESGAPAAEGGAPAVGGGTAEGGSPTPVGNPDAMFQTPCTTDQDCGGPAPICLVPPGPKYCSQIDCLEGEVNEGSCPEGWICFQLNPETRSACLNPN